MESLSTRKKHWAVLSFVTYLSVNVSVNIIKAYETDEIPHLVLQVPDAVAMSRLLVGGATLGKNSTLEAGHVEQQVRVILAVGGNEASFPLNGCHRPRQTILYVPEYSTAPV